MPDRIDYLPHPYERDAPVRPVDDPKVRQAWTVYVERMIAKRLWPYPLSGRKGPHHGQ